MARKGPNEHPGPGRASDRIREFPTPPPSDHGDGHPTTGRWIRGYIGGECGEDNEGGGRFGDLNDWDGDETDLHWCDDHWGLPIARSEISDHFAKDEYLHRGHNTGSWTPPVGPAQPEKQWDTGPQGRESENPKTPGPPVKIPGGGSRPF